MQTECSADLFGFAPVEGRQVVAGFDGGRMTSEAGAMLLGATSGQLRLVERFAGCFTDHRATELVEHTVPSLVGQRVASRSCITGTSALSINSRTSSGGV
jgi:Transposase DDE domain group 1